MTKIDISNLEIPGVIEIYKKRDRTFFLGALVILIIIAGSIFPEFIQDRFKNGRYCLIVLLTSGQERAPRVTLLNIKAHRS